MKKWLISHSLWTIIWLKYWLWALPLACITLGWSILWDVYAGKWMEKTKKKADSYL